MQIFFFQTFSLYACVRPKTRFLFNFKIPPIYIFYFKQNFNVFSKLLPSFNSEIFDVKVSHPVLYLTSQKQTNYSGTSVYGTFEYRNRSDPYFLGIYVGLSGLISPKCHVINSLPIFVKLIYHQQCL